MGAAEGFAAATGLGARRKVGVAGDWESVMGFWLGIRSICGTETPALAAFLWEPFAHHEFDSRFANGG